MSLMFRILSASFSAANDDPLRTCRVVSPPAENVICPRQRTCCGPANGLGVSNFIYYNIHGAQ